MGAAIFSYVDTFEGCFPSCAGKSQHEKLRIGHALVHLAWV